MTRKQNLPLDHITVVARSLDEGAAHIKDALGIEMPGGGAHPRMGTHNRLLALGADCFLELISIDPNAAPPATPRWFDLDNFDGEPRLSTWVVGTDDIGSALTEAHADSGVATRVTRGELSWLISVPEDGTMPLDGAFPTLIEWPPGNHPAERMIDLNCRLRTLVIEHPNVDEIESRIGDQIDKSIVTLRRGDAKRLRAVIETPDGLKELT